MKKTLYVAETDHAGNVVVVWVAGSKDRVARVFDPKMHRIEPVERSEFSGSNAPAIQNWMRYQSKSSALHRY